MFVKETDFCNKSSNDLVNRQNGKTDAGAVISERKEKVGVTQSCLLPKPDVDLLFVNEEEKNISFYLKNKIKKKAFKSYMLLPEKFFNYDIPPPLVLKKWLKSLSGEENSLSEESEEDSLPLIQIKSVLQKNTNHANELEFNLEKNEFSANKSKKKFKEESSGKTKKLKTLNNCSDKKKKDLFINRKRGRPRKSEKELLTANTEATFKPRDASDKEDDPFWVTQTDISDWDILAAENDETELTTDKEEKNVVVISCKEHDYHKSNKEKTFGWKNQSTKKVKKKREKTEIHGIKIENSKLRFPCFDCEKSFSAASTLKHHIRIHNGSLLKCPECHKGFTTKYLLKCHMRIHSGDLFMCHKCGKGFTTAELLKVHSRGHTGDRPFACEVCGKSFPSASNLSQHKHTHETEKKFLCFQCGSSFSQKRCLDGHMITHAEKNHICTVCGKLWARKSDLSEHMRVHTGVKPYCCSVCPQKFTQASSLKRHQIVHLNVKPIQCVTCNKLFKCQDYYKRHVRKHDKEADDLISKIRKE